MTPKRKMRKFNFTRNNLDKKEAGIERLLEIIPGACSWLILSGMLAVSFYKPLLAAVIIIAFNLYWLFRLSYLTFFLVLSYLRLASEKGTEWMRLVNDLSRVEESRYYAIQYTGELTSLKKMFSNWIHFREFEYLKKNKIQPPPLSGIFHLVIIPVVKEAREVVEPGVKSIISGDFPAGKIILVIALEERAALEVKEGVKAIRDKYQNAAYDFLVIEHPDGLVAEARVKGANVTYAAKRMKDYLEEKGISPELVLVSCFDADTVAGPNYFSCLTYYFMVSPDRTKTSFQPIPVYHNNIWEASGFARVLDIGSSFFQLIEATNPEKLVTFSSHSMSFKALVEVGYWPVDLISDDSAIFWKAFIHYNGGYRVIPIYVTLSMDVAHAGSWFKTAGNVYKQKRRWAWGVENFPIVIRGFLKAGNKIPLYDKIRHSFKLFEGHISWATWPFLLIVIGWLPAVFAGREFSNSVFYYSAPRISAIIFHLASLSLVISVILSLCLLPKKKVRNSLLKRVGFALEWSLVPVIAIFFSAIPALDAQTRLMFGRYMEFWVTEKKRNDSR